MKRLKRRLGFTFIEVLVAMGLVPIVLVGTAEMLVRAIQAGRSAGDRILFAETACSRLEIVKCSGPGSTDLAPGHHETVVTPPAGKAILLSWDVEDFGPGILKVICSAAREGDARRSVRTGVLVSARLGF